MVGWGLLCQLLTNVTGLTGRDLCASGGTSFIFRYCKIVLTTIECTMSKELVPHHTDQTPA